MKKILIFILVCSLLLVSGCIVNKKVEGFSQQRIVLTPQGKEVIIPNEVTEYAVLNQSLSETFVDLGFEDNMVVVDKSSLYLGNFRNVRYVYDSDKPDVHSLVEASPEIIVVDDETLAKLDEEQKSELDASGIPIVELNRPKNVEEVRAELAFVTELTDAEYGQAMLDDFDVKYTKIKQLQESRGTYVSGYIQLSETNDEVTTVGNDTFLSSALSEAGVKSVFHDQSGYVITTKEEVARRNPEVFIIVSNDETIGNSIANNHVFDDVQAVENGNLLVVKRYDIMNPNYRCVDWILTLNQKIYE